MAGDDLELDLVLLCARDTGTAALRDALDTGQGLAGIRARLAASRASPRNGRHADGQARSPTPSRAPPGPPPLSPHNPQDTRDIPPRKGTLP